MLSRSIGALVFFPLVLLAIGIGACGTDDGSDQRDMAAERSAERKEREAERKARQRAREARERRRERRLQREARAAAEAEAARSDPSESEENCTPGYEPCLPPASDYDCKDGTGDGPEYTGEVRVTGSDPYGLDSDGDGIGCEGQMPPGPVR